MREPIYLYSLSLQRKTRKAIGFKSLRLNYSDITQINVKMQYVNYC